MHYSNTPIAILLLSLLHISVQGISISSRQTNTAISCPDYSRLANYTVIGTNSTIRAAFLQASPDGTDPTRAILDTAKKTFMQKNMMMDQELNRRCGNLSMVAATEVGKNFTNGIVGPFVIKSVNSGGMAAFKTTGWVVMGLGMSIALLL